MKCKRCSKAMRPHKINHNISKQECSRCHYLGQSSAYPGGFKHTFCKRGHLLTNKKWAGKIRRDCTICQIQLRKERMEILA